MKGELCHMTNKQLEQVVCVSDIRKDIFQ